MLQQFPGKPVRVFVVWEPVLFTDWARPSTANLARIPDPRAAQFWDRGRLISHSMGEHSRKTVEWDVISIFTPGQLWQDRPPKPFFRGRTVVSAQDEARQALALCIDAAFSNPPPS
jgi:hypothetical protein